MIVSKDLGESLDEFIASVYGESTGHEEYQLRRAYWVGCAMMLKMQHRCLELAAGDKIKLEIGISALTNEVQHNLTEMIEDYSEFDPSLN